RREDLLLDDNGEEPAEDHDASPSRSGSRADAAGADSATPASPAPAPVDPSAPIDPASVFEQTPAPAPVPLVPPATGKEDATTAELREAVAGGATPTTPVRQSAEAKRVADAAAAQAAAEAAAAA